MSIPKYIGDWLDIIEHMSNSNTYKLAWGRAIIECCLFLKDPRDRIEISFGDISWKMLKYYWNQIYFFKLRQGPHGSGDPVIYQITDKSIRYYQEATGNIYPIWFNEAESILKQDSNFFHDITRELIKAANQDVCWRFPKLMDEDKDIYELDRVRKKITLNKEQLLHLQEYGIILIQLLNYKWAQLLEQYNLTPRIAQKVRGSQEARIKRSQLTRFKNILLKEFTDGNIIDFYTGKVLDENDISIDHVIPWSFIYSDDIWNLVVTSRSANSSKSNLVPEPEDIERLKNRNQRLLSLLDKGTLLDDLSLAVANDTVDKYYVDCRG